MLRLTVAQAPEGMVQVGESIVVGAQGASIGRGSENTWRLADEERLLSRVHMTVALQGNGFVLADLSTNGVFVNGAQLVRGDCCVLQHGDLIRLGDYLLRAELAGAEEFPAGDSHRTRASEDTGEHSDGDAVEDGLFEADPAQWLMNQLAPEDGGESRQAESEPPEAIATALESVFGEEVRGCSVEEQAALVSELCRLLERSNPHWIAQLRGKGDDATASAFEQLRANVQALD